MSVKSLIKFIDGSDFNIHEEKKSPYPTHEDIIRSKFIKSSLDEDKHEDLELKSFLGRLKYAQPAMSTDRPLKEPSLFGGSSSGLFDKSIKEDHPKLDEGPKYKVDPAELELTAIQEEHIEKIKDELIDRSIYESTMYDYVKMAYIARSSMFLVEDSKTSN